MDSALAPSHHVSSSLEKVLEHRLLADLTTELWCRGLRDFEVLRGEVDAHGYDVVIEARGVLRHIQLKAMVSGGKRRDVGVSLSLARKASGCVIWMIYDPDTLELGPYLWFGGEPGQPLPPVGARPVRHSKADAKGFKAERSGHRLVPRSRFSLTEDIGELADVLFGRETDGPVPREQQMALLQTSVARTDPVEGPVWLEQVRVGKFDGIPKDLAWNNSVELAHLIDGYAIVKNAGWGDPVRFAEVRLARALETGAWEGGPAELWAVLFLEHRRWRMSPHEPDAAMHELLDRLCSQLRTALTTR